MSVKKSESEIRGSELLMLLNIERNQVQKISFSVERFKNGAMAKRWCKNHGFFVEGVPTIQKMEVLVKISPVEKFEAGTLQKSKIGKGIVATIGTPKFVKKVDESEIEEENQEVKTVPAVKRASIEVSFAKRGDLLIRKAEKGDAEVSVRMFGIVMKPEIPDCVGDVTSEKEIENGNFTFMKGLGTVGFMHKKDISDKVCLIQNVIAPIDIEFPVPGGETKMITKGTWYQELYSEDAEIVEKVKGGKLNGLSIGGKAKREEITEMKDGITKLLPDLPFAEQQKRELEQIVLKRNVNKAEGDPALGRFHDLRVEEVSLVDAAANEEDFFIIKRRKEMTKDAKKGGDAATVKSDPVTPEVKKDAPEAAPEATPEAAPELSLTDQISAGVQAGVAAALEATKVETPEVAPVVPEVPAAAPEAAPEGDPVTKGFADIGTRLSDIEKRLTESEKKSKVVETVKAVAKGVSVPDTTTTKKEDAPEEDVSKWTGSAVNDVFGRGRK